VSRAFDAARILRNTVLSNSRDALRTREHQPQLFCDVCHGVIDQHALVRMLCGCQFHRRCALGHVEDHLQQALDTRSDRITCAQPVQHANTYDPTISAFLHQVTQLGQSEGEEAERSIASRTAAIEDQLRQTGLPLEIVDLAVEHCEAAEGHRSQVPAPPPSASPPDSPDPSPRANSPEWIPRPRLFPTGVVICSFCHQSGGPCSAMIQTACSCWVHRTCALTFVENNLSAGFSNGEGMVTCPNPATHEVAQPLFLPRLFDQVTNRNVIGRDDLRDRVNTLLPRIRQLHDLADRVRTSPSASQDIPSVPRREGDTTISDTANAGRRTSHLPSASGSTARDGPTAVPGHSSGRRNGDGEGATPCSYCGRTIDLENRNAGEIPIPIPCGHGGLIHTRCLWIRASHMAHGHRDRHPCSNCSEEPPFGRRPPHPAELVHRHVLPVEGGRWDNLRTLVSVWNAMRESLEIWTATERRGTTVGSYNSFEDMVRAHGRSQTSSYLLVPIFCSAFGLDPPTYIDFPIRGLSIGWTQVTHGYRDLFQRMGIQPHDVLIELPNGTTYICPHVQEYLVHLDPVWESHLTFYTSGVQLALAQPGTPLPPFPQLQQGHHQRGRELIQSRSPANPPGNARSRSEPTTNTNGRQHNRRQRGQRRISGVGVPPVEYTGNRRPRSTSPAPRRTPDTTCGGCSEIVVSGHRVVRQPCGHIYHARCVIAHLVEIVVAAYGIHDKDV